VTGAHVKITVAHDGLRSDGVPTHRLGHRVGSNDGIFAEWEWNGTRLAVCTDRYGFYPLYYYVTDNAIAVSSSIAQLLDLGAPRDIDDTSIAVFLALGFFLGEATAFRFIHTLPPGGRLEWSPAALRVSGSGVAIPQEQQLTRSSAIEGYIELFRQAIRRRPAEGRDCVTLSGGHDSRHILLELCQADRPPALAVTSQLYPPAAPDDVELARHIAAATHVPHIVVPAPPQRWAAETQKNWVTSWCADEHAWLLNAAAVAAREATTLYDGIGGDVLSAGLFLDNIRLTLIRHSAEAFAEHVASRNGARDFLTPDVRQRFSLENACRQIAAEAARHAQAPNPVGSFYFWNRTRREIALSPYALFADVPTVYSPYVDHPLFDHLASLPAELFLDHTFHDDTIRRAYPRYADIPFQNKNAPARRDCAFGRRVAWELLRWLRRSAQRDAIEVMKLERIAAKRLIDGHHVTLDAVEPCKLIWLSEVLALERGERVDVTAVRERRTRVSL
jgi:asparagine synthase (glutamine-hydrolysing)